MMFTRGPAAHLVATENHADLCSVQLGFKKDSKNQINRQRNGWPGMRAPMQTCPPGEAT